MRTAIKPIPLIIAGVLIAGFIWYLQAHQPKQPDGASTDIPVTQEALPEQTASSSVRNNTPLPDRAAIRAQKSAQYPRAKELTDVQRYLNTDAFKLADLVGKRVILIDFWTYSCINCLRTTPYLNAWYKKYKDKGLVIVGVHTPEFAFEKDYDNVAAAVKRLGMTYPVVQDNNYGTWNAYQNRFWPRKFLIDIDGYIVYDHIGEGGYDTTEQRIQEALQERQAALDLHDAIDTGISVPKDMVATDSSRVKSPEIYFGASRNEQLGNGRPGTLGAQKLSLPADIKPNVLYLDGAWDFQKEFVRNTQAQAPAKIVFKYNAKNVYFVASSEQGTIVLNVLRDGKLIRSQDAGSDIAVDGTVLIKENRLYKLIEGSDYGEHTIQIEVLNPGLNAFTFTFG